MNLEKLQTILDREPAPGNGGRFQLLRTMFRKDTRWQELDAEIGIQFAREKALSVQIRSHSDMARRFHEARNQGRWDDTKQQALDTIRAILEGLYRERTILFQKIDRLKLDRLAREEEIAQEWNS